MAIRASALIVLIFLYGIVASNNVVYDDAFGDNWQDWSAATHAVVSSPTHSGSSNSIRWTLGAYSTLSFSNAALVDVTKFESLVFSVYALDDNIQITTTLKDSSYASLGSASLGVTVPKNTWATVAIPLTSFTQTKAQVVMFQFASGTDGTFAYIDDIAFVAKEYIYADGLVGEWQDWSAATHSLDVASPAIGIRSISWNLEAYSTLSFVLDSLVNIELYNNFVFYLYGGTGVSGSIITVTFKDPNFNIVGKQVIASNVVKTAAWNVVYLSVAGFNVPVGTKIRNVMLQFSSGTDSGVLYLDSLFFTSSGTWPIPTAAPTTAPTVAPTKAPTAAPTKAPTIAPTVAPTKAPTTAPTAAPTKAPTTAPTAAPTKAPTTAPTVAPTKAPTIAPTVSPTKAPTTAPTIAPTAAPTKAPTSAPTTAPTKAPTAAPTTSPTKAPTAAPTAAPTKAPTTAPTTAPTKAPTTAPTVAPTVAPTKAPTTAPTATPSKKVKLTGINLSAAGFAPGNLPGVKGPNGDFEWPYPSHIDYFVGLGMNVIRLPFIWERLQPTKLGAFATEYSQDLYTTVQYIVQTKQKYCIVDLHNYQKYYGNIIGESSVTLADYLDVWTKIYNLLSPFGDKIIWGIMNEPLGTDVYVWRNIAQATINKLRDLGATQVILVPGVGYTGASSWARINGDSMWNVYDRLNNIAIEIHSYFDQGTGGNDEACASTTVGRERLDYITKWLKAYNKVGFIGEFGAGRNSVCYSAITKFMQHMEDNNDVWLGWTWWAGGPRWNDYIYNLSPDSAGNERPQVPYIRPFINAVVPSSISIGKYTPAGDVYLPIVDDFGLSPLFDEYSWDSTKNYQSTEKVYKGSYSLSFSGSGLQWASRDRAVFNKTMHTGVSFWVNSNAGTLSQVKIQLIDYTSVWVAVAPVVTANNYVVTTNSDGWSQIFFPFSLFTTLPQYHGLMIMNSAGKTYLDEVYLVHKVTKNVVA